MAVRPALAPWGVNTDTSGSVRIPAGWCRVVGLKSTLGGTSTHGVLPLAPSLDTPGPIFRDAEIDQTGTAALFGTGDDHRLAAEGTKATPARRRATTEGKEMNQTVLAIA